MSALEFHDIHRVYRAGESFFATEPYPVLSLKNPPGEPAHASQ